MPIYTFNCKRCHAEFDTLVGVGRDEKKPFCTICKSSDLKRLFSTFGIGKSSKLDNQTQAVSGKSCSNCNSTNCSTCY